MIRIQRSWKKNVPDLLGLLGRYPRFVTDIRGVELENELPVFCFHEVVDSRFEAQLQFLSNNGYKTLNADEAERALVSNEKIPSRTVVLTFDDGRRSLWEVAHPLLERHGMQAVCFLVSGLIREDGSEKKDPLVNWGEVRTMHEAGTVDFQSHTHLHSLVFTGPKVVDYVRPGLDLQFRNTELPVLLRHGEDDESREASLGTPLYAAASRMSDHLRYFDDEYLRQELVEMVAGAGGAAFFSGFGWRRKLDRHVRSCRGRGLKDGYENPEERRSAIRLDLENSRKIIEKHLGREVRHLCYPWFSGSDESVSLSREAGFATNFWGILTGRRTNRPGMDLYRITRVPDDYLFRLPGKGRWPLGKCLADKARRLGSGAPRC